MAKASTIADASRIRSLFVGDSGTGKTGALLSLIMAGYTIRTLDYDGGAESLIQLIKKHCPERIDQLDVIALRDEWVADSRLGIRPKGTPVAYTKGLRYLNKWDDDSIPCEWGDDTVFVLDSMTSFGRAAFLWARAMNPTSKDPRQWYGAAQDSIKNALDLLTSKNFGPHVLVISHLQLVEPENGAASLQVTAIGKALGPDIPKVFNNMVLATKSGSGDNVKRQIETKPTPLLDLKLAAPWLVDRRIPLETGLATIFEKLLDRPGPAVQKKPK